MFSFTSIDAYHRELTEGRTSCVEAVDHYLERIGNFRHLNAFVEVFASEARARAAWLDQQRAAGKRPGLLHGVIIGIKDVLCYQGHAVTAASRILQGFHSLYTATAVERLLEEGAILIGSLNCDEFAMGSTNENSFYGRVLNGLDESRVPGGSSGGSAVAVQTGCCMLSLGSDTGGSVRQPADFCGLVGLKPTYGRISRYGLIAYASSFDQIGIFGHRVEDVALALQVMAGPDAFDSTASQRPVPAYTPVSPTGRPVRFAYFREALDHPGLDPEIAAAIRGLLERLSRDGHQVTEVPFEYLDYIVPAYYVLTTAEASSNLSRYDGVRFGYRTSHPVTDLEAFYKKTRSEGFGREVKRRILLGTFVLSTGYYDAYFTRAQQVRRMLRDRTRDIFRQHDFILLPVSPTTAFPIGEKLSDPIAMYLADIYTVMANLTGIPALSLPLFRHSNGMPFGIQVMANDFEELSLLQVSSHLLQQYKYPV
ncbi:MAG TPA: Asp-tRNA(Asn)/Glu-tRNA(Gln) amidotransferase subunit GatA [Chitinophagaceae bacterium]|nr:Asp-tRNA(Asn)/Glu-tRNA(Gln) amidotransferase subunit GatA [Chitinophagaceae bacterium]